MEAAGAAVEENEMKFSDKIIGNSKFGDFSETEAATAAPTTVPPHQLSIRITISPKNTGLELAIKI